MVADELTEAQRSIAELAADKDSMQCSLAATKASLQACEDKLVSAEVIQLIGHSRAQSLQECCRCMSCEEEYRLSQPSASAVAVPPVDISTKLGSP